MEESQIGREISIPQEGKFIVEKKEKSLLKVTLQGNWAAMQLKLTSQLKKDRINNQHFFVSLDLKDPKNSAIPKYKLHYLSSEPPLIHFIVKFADRYHSIVLNNDDPTMLQQKIIQQLEKLTNKKISAKTRLNFVENVEKEFDECIQSQETKNSINEGYSLLLQVEEEEDFPEDFLESISYDNGISLTVNNGQLILDTKQNVFNLQIVFNENLPAKFKSQAIIYFQTTNKKDVWIKSDQKLYSKDEICKKNLLVEIPISSSLINNVPNEVNVSVYHNSTKKNQYDAVNCSFAFGQQDAKNNQIKYLLKKKKLNFEECKLIQEILMIDKIHKAFINGRVEE